MSLESVFLILPYPASKVSCGIESAPIWSLDIALR